MPSSFSSKLWGRQPSEQRPQDPPAKRQKLAPRNSTYWDTLSKIWLTKCALAELDRRNISAKEQDHLYSQLIRPQQSLTQQLESNRDPLIGFAPEHIKSVKQFSRAGGPDLSDLRNYPEPSLIYRLMSPSRSISRRRVSQRKRSAESPPPSTRPTKTTTKTTSTSAYSRNFEQKLIDNGFYPKGYKYRDGQIPPKPSNWGEINERLIQPRSSLSPSRFSESDFQNFEEADTRASKENPVMEDVIPILEGKAATATAKGGYLFGNLAPLIKSNSNKKEEADAKPELAQAKPDRLYGATPEQLERPIRDKLNDQIIPSTQDSLPILPNFFLEAKGPDGAPAVVTRQALYYGALGARGMHALQSYKQKKIIYDNKARTVSSTYIAGTLKLYTHHIIPSMKEGRESETIMTQLNGYAMTGNRETFIQGASAYRNLRDWAQEQRDEFIENSNEAYLMSQPESHI
ncbi:hypothetical protein FQN57_000709 [Myotisia sp. PD_48]|nr:hypothetical protein FQN57_000709 [Myotisia sp. PD_48]